MPETNFLPQPSLKERAQIYARKHWKQLTVAIAFAIAAWIAVYSLWLQNIINNNPISPLRLTTSDAVYSPLTGLEVTQDLADRPVTAVMIENSPDARPQSSLSQAGVVFETVAEGGITRYLALYQEAQPKVIGPVRSLRPYYLDWAMGFNAHIAHAGGSDDAMGQIGEKGAKSLNGLVYGHGYWRANDRAAPHNFYTSSDNLDNLARELGYFKTFPFEGYRYNRKEQPAAATNTVISMDFSGPAYSAQFRYDGATNSYLRYVAGQPDIDRENSQQIRVKNLVVVPMPTAYDGKYAVINTIGGGDVVVFRDGISIKGSWKKDSPGDQFSLLDSQGKPIPLNPGSTWIAVVPADRAISY